jgi:hypothetical protein
MIELFDSTYSHFAANPLFIRILASENLLGAKFLTRSKASRRCHRHCCWRSKKCFHEAKEGVFRRGIDPLQLYVSMVAMSYVHILNAPTFSHFVRHQPSSPSWRAAAPARHRDDDCVFRFRAVSLGRERNGARPDAILRRPLLARSEHGCVLQSVQLPLAVLS